MGSVYGSKSMIEQLRDQGVNYQGELMTYEEARRRGIRLDDATEARLEAEEKERKARALFRDIADMEFRFEKERQIFEEEKRKKREQDALDAMRYITRNGFWDPPRLPPPPELPPPPPETPEEKIPEAPIPMVESGVKKKLSLVDLFKHEFAYGKYLSEYEAERSARLGAEGRIFNALHGSKRTCMVCQDLSCPFSD